MKNIADKVEKLNQKKKSVSLSEKAYQNIKEAIVTCKFKPGDSLSENMLAEVLDMSRTPVREALKRLSNENLVVIKRGTGVYVKDISIQDLKELYEVRKALECTAVVDAVNNITVSEINKEEKTWNSIMDRINNGEDISWEEICEYDRRLHSLIIDRCDNSYLKTVVNNISAQIYRYQYLSAEAHNNVLDTAEQHIEIINLIKEKNKEKLRQTMGRHIDSAAENIIQKLVK